VNYFPKTIVRWFWIYGSSPFGMGLAWAGRQRVLEYWLISIAWVINLIVAFYLSIWVERYIVEKLFKEIEK
jgi:hypothetical protein